MQSINALHKLSEAPSFPLNKLRVLQRSTSSSNSSDLCVVHRANKFKEVIINMFIKYSDRSRENLVTLTFEK